MVREISPDVPTGGSRVGGEAKVGGEVKVGGDAKKGEQPEENRLHELEQTLESLREDSEVAHVLLGLSGVLAEVRSLEDTIDIAVKTVGEVFGADRCCVLSTQTSGGGLEVLACTGYDNESLAALRKLAALPEGMPVLRDTLREGVPIFLPQASQDDRLQAQLEILPSASFIALPLVRWGERFGAVAIEYSEPRVFGNRELALARGVSRLLGVALVNARRFSMLSSLRSFGLSVARKLSLSSVIEDVAWGGVELLSGDLAKVYFLDAMQETLVEAGGFSDEPSKDAPLTRIDLHEDPWSNLLQGRAIVVNDLGTPDDHLSAVAAPIPGDLSPILGAVIVFFRRQLAGSPEELEALSVLANQAGMAVENANRYERQRQVARSLQQGLLSTEMPELKQIEVAAIYEPASGDKDIGGDFYDVFALPNGTYGLAVGDVSGKGAEAAARTAMVKYMMRAFATADPSPARVLHSLNDALTRDLEAERFATLVYGVLDPDALKFTIGRAGHPPPLIYRAIEKSVEALEDPLEGPVLGCLEDQQFTELTFALSPGDVFVLYTDGLIETRSSTGFYGRRRVEQAVKRFAGELSMAELARKLYQEAYDFGTVGDDTVVFALRCKG